MLFLPSVNFDYGAKPVMAPLSSLSCLLLLLITWCGWCGAVDWELRSTLFTNSWLSRLAGLQHQARANSCEHTITAAHVTRIPFSRKRSPAKPISVLQVAAVALRTREARAARLAPQQR